MEKTSFTCVTLSVYLFGRNTLMSCLGRRVRPLWAYSSNSGGLLNFWAYDKERGLHGPWRMVIKKEDSLRAKSLCRKRTLLTIWPLENRSVEWDFKQICLCWVYAVNLSTFPSS